MLSVNFIKKAEDILTSNLIGCCVYKADKGYTLLIENGLLRDGEIEGRLKDLFGHNIRKEELRVSTKFIIPYRKNAAVNLIVESNIYLVALQLCNKSGEMCRHVN